MALMFPRLARNFACNGYYPTDEVTLERALQALAPTPSGRMRIFDPCAGEGAALIEAAHVLGRDQVDAYAVEYDRVRAEHARKVLDRVLHSDLMDTMISRQTFGLLWLNPPYGDLVSEHAGASQYQGKGRRRLEKLFYQRSLPLLQYGGVMVLIVPHYVLDDEFCGWLCNHFTALQIYSAADPTFKQVVIFGIRVRRQDLAKSSETAQMREVLRAIGAGQETAPDLPANWQGEHYAVLPAVTELEHFYKISLEPEQFGTEIQRLRGLWPDFTLHFGQTGVRPRPPVRQLSRWHLALALAAGAISGVVTSRSGRVLALKDDTYKDKVSKSEFAEDENGNVSESRILTDRFIPIIRAWDLTPGSANLGQVITISSSADETPEPEATPPAPATDASEEKFDPGYLLLSQSVKALVEGRLLNITPFYQRHLAGDWGEICEEDWNSNQQSLITGGRLISGYDIDARNETRLWIITDMHRSATTVLLPSDF